jgi:hypothetical protein
MERQQERSLGELFGDLTRSLTTLVRQEIDLARTEIMTRASRMSMDAAMVGVGGALLYAALVGLLAAVILVLIELGVPAWVATIIVALVVGLAGGALVASGRERLKKANLVPRRTIETVHDDAEWAKERFQ